MVWIDYKKAYDMVLHSWILKCLEMVGAAKNMISVISNSIANWKTVLTSGGTALGQVDIRRGIFQGDSLSPLLFIVIMLPLTLILQKMRAGYRLAKDMKPINHLLFMDNLKLYGASRDQLDSLIQVDYEKRKKDEKVENWKEKALLVEFIQQISDEAGEESWRWLRNEFLKKETEGLIMATQEQALRTNSIKYIVDKTSETPLCRLRGDTTETSWIPHLPQHRNGFANFRQVVHGHLGYSSILFRSRVAKVLSTRTFYRPPTHAGVVEEDMSSLGVLDLNTRVQWSVDRAWDVLYCEQVLMEVASAHEDILLPIFLNLTYEEMCHQARSDQRSMVTVILQEGDNIPDVIRILNILHGINHGNLYFWITKEKSRSGREEPLPGTSGMIFAQAEEGQEIEESCLDIDKEEKKVEEEKKEQKKEEEEREHKEEEKKREHVKHERKRKKKDRRTTSKRKKPMVE
ncbi:Retrovirus-related Pol polyprotein from type-1 retrotransposable element R2, partial [Stylophora pistillata]